MQSVCFEGFMYGSQVLDKDGICAAAVIAELACYLYSKGTTVDGHLATLYQKLVPRCTLLL